MSSQTSTSFMPEKLRILSGSALKMLAMAIMLIDHTASFLLRHYPPAISALVSNRQHHLFPIPGNA